MPATSFVEVDVVISPRAAARASLSISTLLHGLTDDQDANFGTARNVLLLGNNQAWKDTLDTLGISVGEIAYNDVEAHFSQDRVPERAWLARRGDPTGTQVKQIVILEEGGSGFAPDGTYRLIDIEGGPYSFVASGNTMEEVRDGLIASITGGTHPSFSESTVGTVAIDMTATAVGVNLPMTLESPTGGATLTVTSSFKELKRKLITDVTFASGADGLYSLTVQTSTGQKVYQYTEISGSGTGGGVAAALKVEYDADPSDLFEPTVGISTATLTFTAAVAGTPGTITVSSPNADATITVAQTNYNICDDIDKAFGEEDSGYLLLNGSREEIDILQAAECIEPMRKLHIGQTDADAAFWPDMKAAAFGRTMGVYHPIDAEGVHAAWAGDVLVDEVGAVNWAARPLKGLTGSLPTPAVAAFLEDNNTSYLERFEARSQDIMVGGYSFEGRPMDLRRAADTFFFGLETALLDLIVRNRIIPYTDTGGISQVEGVIRSEFERAREQGYGVSLELNVPRISDATTNEKQRGILPEFTGHIVVQLGVYKIRANFTMDQE